MDMGVCLVQSYLRVHGYFTVSEYPILEAMRHGDHRIATDIDILAVRFPHACQLVPRQGRREDDDVELAVPDAALASSARPCRYDHRRSEDWHGRAQSRCDESGSAPCGVDAIRVLRSPRHRTGRRRPIAHRPHHEPGRAQRAHGGIRIDAALPTTSALSGDSLARRPAVPPPVHARALAGASPRRLQGSRLQCPDDAREGWRGGPECDVFAKAAG